METNREILRSRVGCRALRCLLIDEGPDGGSQIKRMIRDCGHEVVHERVGEFGAHEVGRLDLAILVIDGPHTEPAALIAALRTRRRGVPIMAVSDLQRRDRLLDAIRAGADGYLDLVDAPFRLSTALEELSRGAHPISERAAALLLEEVRRVRRGTPVVPNLSPRERMVLDELAAGATYAKVAERAGISLNTVRHHVRNAYRKLGAEDRLGAIRRWHVEQKRLARTA